MSAQFLSSSNLPVNGQRDFLRNLSLVTNRRSEVYLRDAQCTAMFNVHKGQVRVVLLCARRCDARRLAEVYTPAPLI